ncbi:MAG: DUF1415 domain-containing protein, partial [Ramlibacter sp.]
MSRLNPAGSHEAKRQLAARVLSDTQAWLQCAVIGLNLCPFAKAVSVKGLVYCAISEADGPQALLQDLAVELRDLAASDAAQRETTLLVAPYCLDEFLLFNEFLGKAQSLLRKEGFEGVIQLASFHPAYQFAGSASDDITNFTNRS